MQSNYESSLSLVLVHEGGWADHPKDPGGATMKGVTIGTYSDFLGRPATKPELRAISEAHLEAIYRRRYWDAVRADELPAGVDYCTFDAAVNSGPTRAARWLQIAIGGVVVDGEIGPRTVAAARDVAPAWVINRYCDVRLAFLKTLKTWPTFGKGWARRVEDVRKHALAMVP
jgi:lysozyme family protein